MKDKASAIRELPAGLISWRSLDNAAPASSNDGLSQHDIATERPPEGLPGDCPSHARRSRCDSLIIGATRRAAYWLSKFLQTMARFLIVYEMIQ